MSARDSNSPVRTQARDQHELRYAIVVGTHGTRSTGLSNLLKSLTQDRSLRIYIVDSSDSHMGRAQPRNIIDNGEYGLRLDSDVASRVVKIRVRNLGAPHSLNTGVRRCIADGAELITLLDDDVSLGRPFPADQIAEFFLARCDPSKDLLILPGRDGPPPHDDDLNVTSGMTFSPLLFSICQFREDLVMDLFDFQFCEEVLKHGGKLVRFPGAVIKIGPIGGPSRDGVFALPNWRLYLLVRNSLALARERTGVRTGSPIFALYQVAFWLSLSFLVGRDLRDVLFALTYGVADAVSGHLGITRTLQKLSHDRFDLSMVDGVVSNGDSIGTT